MRKFIRHPIDIPILCLTKDNQDKQSCCTKNISMGGLCFHYDEPVKPRSIVQIKIAICNPPYETDAIVIWCKNTDNGYDVGVMFNDDNAQFSVRMIEQICHIEHYRNEVIHKEGRHLSNEQAAEEWIKQHAKDFPF